MARKLTFDTGVLDALGLLCGIAEPVELAGQILDLELVWMSQPLALVAGTKNLLGAHLSDTYPALYDGGWLEELVVSKTTGKPSVRYLQSRQSRKHTSGAYEITARWVDGLMLFTVADMSVRDASNADIVRMASLMADVLEETPMVFRVSLPADTLEFDTLAFKELVGGPRRLNTLTIPEDHERVRDWMHAPIETRAPSCTFRIVTVDGGTRWMEARAEAVNASDVVFVTVRDIDAYLSGERMIAVTESPR